MIGSGRSIGTGRADDHMRSRRLFHAGASCVARLSAFAVFFEFWIGRMWAAAVVGTLFGIFSIAVGSVGVVGSVRCGVNELRSESVLA